MKSVRADSHRPRRLKGDVVSWSKPLYRGLSRAFDPKQDLEMHGFYGSGAYFSPTPDDARVWGETVVKYKPTRTLKLLENRRMMSDRSDRGDYLAYLPEEVDGIYLHYAEGGAQILLRSFGLVKPEKTKVKADPESFVHHVRKSYDVRDKDAVQKKIDEDRARLRDETDLSTWGMPPGVYWKERDQQERAKESVKDWEQERTTDKLVRAPDDERSK